MSVQDDLQAAAVAAINKMNDDERHLEDSALVINGLQREAARLAEEGALKTAEIAKLQKQWDDHMATHPVKPPMVDPKLFAIRVLPHHKGSVYWQHAAILDELQQLGVKRISGQIGPNTQPQVVAFYRTLIDRGCKLWLTVGEPHVPLSDADWKKVDAVVSALADGIEKLFGWNEPNKARSPKVTPANWVLITNMHQYQLFTRYGDRFTIGTPQLWSGEPEKQFVDLAKLCVPLMVALDPTKPKVQTDISLPGHYHEIAWHYYMRHDDPGLVLDTSFLEKRQEPEFRRILKDTTSKIVCSESGFFTASAYVGNSNPVTLEQQAALIPQLAKWYSDRGYGCVYFELMDDPDPEDNDREFNFGLVEVDTQDPETWTHKPAFKPVHDMILAA